MAVIFMNSGSIARTWPEVLRAQQKYESEFEVDPSSSLFKTWERMWGVQNKVAGFFSARPIDIFLRLNVTQALNDFIMGAQLPPGDIAVTDLEYGAIVNVCKLKAQMESRNLQVIKLGASRMAVSEDEVVEMIVKQVKPSMKMLLVSHIMTGTGLTVPIKKLARRTREMGIVLVVDGAHGPGAVPVNFQDLEDVDFYGGNLHKWMKGPKGTAFGWIPERNRKLFRPTWASWTTFETHPVFEPFGGGDRFAASTAMAYCLNFPSFYALSDLIDVWKHETPEKVHDQLRKRRERIISESAGAIPGEIVSPQAKDLQSPLVTFSLPEKMRAKGMSLRAELVERARVSVALPVVADDSHIRLSCHVDVSLDEVSEGLSRLKMFFTNS